MAKKDTHKTIHLAAATIFALIAVLHVLRLFYGWPAVIGAWPVPAWLSVVAVLVAGYLAIMLWRTK